jgi:hypothetical protein
MNDLQLYITVGIPTFTVLVGILMNVVHHNSVNALFSSMDARFSGMETRFT